MTLEQLQRANELVELIGHYRNASAALRADDPLELVLSTPGGQSRALPMRDENARRRVIAVLKIDEDAYLAELGGLGVEADVKEIEEMLSDSCAFPFLRPPGADPDST